MGELRDALDKRLAEVAPEADGWFDNVPADAPQWLVSGIALTPLNHRTGVHREYIEALARAVDRHDEIHGELTRAGEDALGGLTDDAGAPLAALSPYAVHRAHVPPLLAQRAALERLGHILAVHEAVGAALARAEVPAASDSDDELLPGLMGAVDAHQVALYALVERFESLLVASRSPQP